MDVDDVGPGMSVEPMDLDSTPDPSMDDPSAKRARRLVPDEPSQRLYANWLALIPSLLRDFLHYVRIIHGSTRRPSPQFVPVCEAGCSLEVASLQCLYVDRE